MNIEFLLNSIYFVVYLLATFICSTNAQFSDWIRDELITKIGNVMSNIDSIPPFVDKNVYAENPTLAVEQALIRPFRTDPDQARTCGQLIESRGYQYETHFVITKDGYILRNYRIVNPYARKFCKKLKPILLVHGVLVSCSSWLIVDPSGHIKPWTNGCPPNDTSAPLGYHLANQCNDVWLINIRGTSYSTNHTHLNPHKGGKFWEFSFQEIGLIDIPETVIYIKKVTGYDRITIVAISQGTFQMIVNLAGMPEFQKNYDIVILADPAGYLGNLRGVAGIFPHQESTNRILASMPGPLLPMQAYTYASASLFCSQPRNQPVCLEVFNSIFGTNSQQTNASRAGVYVSIFDQSSVQNFVHIFQAMNTDHILYYNHGKDKNLLIYGTPEPPSFPYHLIDARKLILIKGLNDAISTPENIQKFLNSLTAPPLVDHTVPFPLWNHVNDQLAYGSYPYFTTIVRQFIEKYGDP